MKAMSFSNVKMGAEVEKYLRTQGLSLDRVNVHPQLEPVIAKLAVLYPLWMFTGDGRTTMNGESVLTYFEVRCDGELLGEIKRSYEGRDYQICVSNQRIKQSMERGRFYKTLDPNKAVAKVKKMFSPMTTQEITEAVRDRAAHVAQSAEWNKGREEGEAMDIVRRAAHKYVMGAGFEMFINHVKDNYPAQEYTLIVDKHEVAKRAKEELVTITATKQVLSGKRKGAIITQRGATYVVECDDKLEICDDNTLPEWIRSRIGMLKLIEPGQFISDSGMRADKTVFVLIKPEEENLTTVSEGETK